MIFYIHSELITTVKLINVSLFTHLQIFRVLRVPEISLSKFPIYNIVWITIGFKKIRIILIKENSLIESRKINHYTESYKALMKEIKSDANKWKDSPYSQIQITNVKMTMLLKAIYRCSAIPIEILMAFFTERE